MSTTADSHTRSAGPQQSFALPLRSKLEVLGGEAGAGFLELVPSEHNPEESFSAAFAKLHL